MLLNYHISRFVLGSLCVGDLVCLGLSSVRVGVICFVALFWLVGVFLLILTVTFYACDHCVLLCVVCLIG